MRREEKNPGRQQGRKTQTAGEEGEAGTGERRKQVHGREGVE